MKRIESEMIIHFLYRPTMYIPEVNKKNIISFMHGVDFGKRNKPLWTTLLQEYIVAKYNIEGGALGWPNQVEILSKRAGLEWTEGFRKLMMAMIKDSDQIPFTKKIEALSKKLASKE